jgi:glycosyltransferase involved in cell wall biosynthesis
MISKASVTALYREKQRRMVERTDGVDLTLVVPHSFGGVPYEPDSSDPYATVQLPLIMGSQHHLHLYRGLNHVFRMVQPDLVHIDEEHYSLVTAVATRMAQRRSVPSVFFTWQNIMKRYPWPFRSWERYVLQRSAGAIAGSAEAADVLRAKGYRGPLAVIPQFGTSPDRYRPLSSDERAVVRAQWGIAAADAVVGFVGRLVPEKGLDTLAAAMAPVLRADPSRHLLFVGDGPWRSAGERWADREGVTERVHWVNRVPSPSMPRIVGGLDLLVLPSTTTPRWKEQFGRVLVEAMAAEVPVVGSSSGEIPHVVGDAGLVFPEGDAPALASAVERLLTRPEERAAYGRRGRNRVIRDYTPDAIAAQTLAFYRALSD